jgi:hypothetical protein
MVAFVSQAVISGAFSPTGEHFATGSEDGSAQVHLTDTGEMLQRYHAALLGSDLCNRSDVGFDVSDGRIDLARGYAMCVAFCPDSEHIVVCTGGACPDRF